MIVFTDPDGRPLGIKGKIIWRYLLINRDDTIFELSNATVFYRTKNKKIGLRIWIFMDHSQENIKNNSWIQNYIL